MAGRKYKYRKDLSKQIKNARIGKKLSQEQLAEACGVSRQTVARWERGDRVPSLSSLERIAQVLNIPLVELLSGTPEGVVQESTACAVDEPQEDGSPEGVVQESAASAEAAQESTGFAETLQERFKEHRGCGAES